MSRLSPMRLIHGQEPPSRTRRDQKRSCVQNMVAWESRIKSLRISCVRDVVAWKQKMMMILVVILCFLPISHAGWTGQGSFEVAEKHGGTTASNCQREKKGRCFNEAEALKLKVTAIAIIFLSSLMGVTLPLLGRQCRFLHPDSKAIFVAKVFGGGVILATGFIHMLPDASEKLGSECLPERPWRMFPWSTFFAMVTVLVMNVIEFLATGYYESQAKRMAKAAAKAAAIEGTAPDAIACGVPADDVEKNSHYHTLSIQVLSPLTTPKVCHHASTPTRGVFDRGDLESPLLHHQEHNEGEWHGTGGHVHGLPYHTDEEGLKKVRSIVVAQVLELGIASHSILIGLAIGVSFSPCDIRSLLGALVFHQFFEGVALGGCITQAGFQNLSNITMSLVFACTTPLGICLGLFISDSYNPQSVTALLTEGILDSISAGILIYMALVNLIANEFFGARVRSDRHLQVMAFIALFSGAGAMSIIGIWT